MNDPRNNVSVDPAQPTTDHPNQAPMGGRDTDRPVDTSHSGAPTTDPSANGAFNPFLTATFTPLGESAGHAPTPTVPGYEILGELGRGGMGVVWKARQVALNRVVALKMILAGGHSAPEAVSRFLAEAQAVAQFQHPNIVQIHEIGACDGLPYFSLEYVDGVTLAKKIAREPQPPRFAAEMVEKLARAMQYAHERKIVHRDLKPANILLTADGTPKIADFGLAKQLEGESGLTQDGKALGTPSFMAPEQAAGEHAKVGTSADVYALGAILYDLLTGRPPFVGSSVFDTMEMVRHSEPVAPSQLISTLPRDVETICLKCLQKEPTKRYASAHELAEELRRFLDGRPIIARPVGNIERAWRWAKRNPWVAGLGTSVAALLLTVAVVTSVLSWQLSIKKAAAEESARLEGIARDNERLEKQKSNEARAGWVTQQSLSLDLIRGVLLQLDNGMRGKPELLPLRRQLIDYAMRDFEKLRNNALDSRFAVLEGRNEAIGYAKMGEILALFGKVEEAGTMYERAALILIRLEAEDESGDGISKHNLANITNRRAEIALRLGNGIKARDMYTDALRIRKEWLQLKPDHDPAKLAVAESHMLIGWADLMLGDPAAAVSSYETAKKQIDELPPTAEWRDAKEQRLIALDRLVLPERLGDVYYRTGRWAEAEQNYRALLKVRQEAVDNAPNNDGLAIGLAQTQMALGDFLFATTNDAAKARAEYDPALSAAAALLKKDKHKDNLELQRLVAAAHYRLGVTAESGSADAAEHFTAALTMRQKLATFDPKDTQAKIELMLALGRVGKAAESEKLADALLRQAKTDRRVLFQTACGLAVISGNAAPEIAARCRDRAFSVLADLVKNGWKDKVSLETDPDLVALRADPRFAELLAKILP